MKIQEIEENKKKNLFQLKQDNDAKIKEASKELVEVESSRDAEIKKCQNEMEKLEELTSSIIENVDKLSKAREATIAEFNELGIRQENLDPSLVYMPFYLSRYQIGENKRYTYLAPSVVSSGGLGARLKAMGKVKISQLLQPRSKKISYILNSFIRLLEENIVFSHEINDACTKANLLQPKASESIKKGLDALKANDWLSEREFESFSQAINQFI